MTREANTMNDLIYEKDNFDGTYHTKVMIIKKKEHPIRKGFMKVPKWKLFIISLILIFLVTVLVSAVVFILNAKRPGNYLESCQLRSCEPSLKMKCINGVCNCTSDQYFSKGCQSKRSFDESCKRDTDCKGDLICLYGKCTCNSDYYWSGLFCLARFTYGDNCANNNQCLSRSFLNCTNNFCTCDSTRFWTGFECKRKSPYGQKCRYSVDECLYIDYLVCTNNTCLCNDTLYYYNTSTLLCQYKKNEYQSCDFDNMCLGDMLCSGAGTNKLCKCPPTFYFNETQLRCLPETFAYTLCASTNRTCRTDLGLSCQSNLCLCDSRQKFWYNSSIGCIDYFTYNQSLCFDNSNCLPGLSLFCNLNPTTNMCNCPLNSITGMCDCVRVYKNESYWDSASSICKPAMSEWSTCFESYQCMSDMFCNSTMNQCQCEFTKYFDINAYICVPKTLNNTVCSSTNTCRSDLGLSCQSGLCQCNMALQFWSNSSSGCINYLSYGDTCSSNYQCSSNQSLFCNLAPTINQCNCNKTSITGMCDCIKVIGNESFWDYGLGACLPAKPYNSTCSMDYECRTLTEKTYCSSGRCICVNGTDVGFLKTNGICGYCTGGKLIASLGKCFQSLTMTGTSCPQKSFNDCLKLKCNETFASSSIAILSSPTIFNETISALLTTVSFSTGTYIGGYYEVGSSSWKWNDGSVISTVLGAGEWKPTTIFTGFNAGSNNVCLKIEASSSPVYFEYTDCNLSLNVLCQTIP